MTPNDADDRDWSDDVRTDTGDIIGRTGRWVLVAFGVFVAWAALYPIDSAVVAPGTVISEGRNQVLQHRSGGAVRQIRAREGDLLEAGDIVLELDPLVDRALLTRLRSRQVTLEALRRRLEAEKTDASDLVIAFNPEALELRGEDGVPQANTLPVSPEATLRAQLNDEQAREFETGRLAVESEIDALESRASGLRDQREGYAKRIAALTQQLDLLGGQLEAAQALADAGHIARQQVWQLESQVLERQGLLAETIAADSTAANSIDELDAQIQRVRMTDGRTTSQQLTEVLAEMAQISDELAAAELALKETAIRAPVRGHLVRLIANTIGGVIAPGDTVGEIVPTDGEPEIQMRVQPKDIALVSLGQPTDVQITAFNPRLFDPVPATVTYIARDSTLDQITGMPYFEVRARVSTDVPAEIRSMLLPGMAGDAFLRGQSRTFLSFLFQPFIEGLSRSFREPQ